MTQLSPRCLTNSKPHHNAGSRDADTKTPQESVFGLISFSTTKSLLYGCHTVVRDLITASLPDDVKIDCIQLGTEVKITNGIDWIWARVDAVDPDPDPSPRRRLFDATILSTLSDCPYNAGSHIRIDGRRIFAIRHQE